jgi:hypothetical protein
MHIHGRWLKLFKYCVNELYCICKIAESCPYVCMAPTLWIFMNLMFEDF